MTPCEFCGDTTDTHQPWGLVECVDFDACLHRRAAKGDDVAAQLVEERRARKARRKSKIE